MLTLLFLVSCLFFIFVGRVRTGNLFSPLTFYMFFWCFWAVISLSNPYGLYEVSTSTYLLIWMSISSFAVGFILTARKIELPNTKGIKLLGNDIVKKKLFVWANIMIFVVLVYYYKKYSSILFLVPGDMRDVLYGGYLFRSAIEHLFYFTIITPLVYLSIAMTLSNTVMGSKNKLILLLTLINGILLASIGGGRFVYFHMIFFVIISVSIKAYLGRNKSTNLRKGRLKKGFFYAFILLMAVFAMNFTTAIRMGESSSFSNSFNVFLNTALPQMVVYFTGPFRTLDYFLNTDITSYVGNTFGRATLGGIDELLSFFVNFITPGSGTFTTANSISSSFTAPPILIGEGKSFNAFYTSIMNFYLDGGISFVIMISVVFGLISGSLYNFCLRNLNIFTFTLLVYTTYQLVASQFRWNYQAPATFIVIAVLLVGNNLYRKRNKKSVNIEGRQTVIMSSQ